MDENGARLPVQDAVEQIASDARNRVEQMAEQTRVELAEMQARLGDLRRDLTRRSDTARSRAANELRTAAKRIRQKAHESGDSIISARAMQLAEGLEHAAQRLDKRPNRLQTMINVCQENVWQILAAAFGIGLVVGLLVALSKRR